MILAYWIIAAIVWPFMLWAAVTLIKSLDIDTQDFNDFIMAGITIGVMPFLLAAVWIYVLPISALCGLVYLYWRRFIKIN